MEQKEESLLDSFFDDSTQRSGQRSSRCTCCLVVDTLLAMAAATCTVYGLLCSTMTGGNNADGVCPPGIYAMLVAFLGFSLALRPMWLVLHRVFTKRRCPSGVLYYSCR